MSAEVTHLSYVANQRLASTGIPWWGTGSSSKERRFDDWITSDQAREAIGFPVSCQPLYRRTQAGLYEPLTDARETFRPELDKHLGTVGMDYVPVPGDVLVSLGDEIVDHRDAHWDTVGVLRNDRLIFGTIRLDVVNQAAHDGLVAIDGSEYYTWLLVWGSHDASTDLGAAVVKVRTVCLNTFKGGLSSAKSEWRIRHTGDVINKAVEARRALGLITKQEAEFTANAQRMAATEFALTDWDAFSKACFTTTKEPKTEHGQARREAALAEVKSNWLHSETIPDEVRMTNWGVFNGITEWAEHIRPIRKLEANPEAERRLLTGLFGGPVEKLRDRATRLLTVA